jgi:MFS transporter, putative metabolite:H+ symporter
MPDRDLMSVYAESRPTRRYYGAYAIFCTGYTLDTFDFYVVGFLLAVLGPAWHLTYGQSGLILLSAGAGSFAGALVCGGLADAFGRKAVLVPSTVLCGVGAASAALVSDHAWEMFALLRFLVGFGLAGVATTQMVLLVETTPLHYRTRLVGFPHVAASRGALIASISAASMLNVLGWRGVAVLGLVPLLIVVALTMLIIPESAQWLISKGRFAKARRSIAALMQVPAESLPLDARLSTTIAPSAKFRELLAYPWLLLLVVVAWAGLSTAGFGVYLWGPTITAALLHITPSEAAHYFVMVASAGILGRVLFSLLPIWIGRKNAGAIFGFGITATMTAAAFTAHQSLFGVPSFIVFIVIGALFFDGGYCIVGPYTVEIFPTQMAGRAMGLGQAANGVGKVAGPLVLALIAGSGNVLSPHATVAAVLPSFLFLAACGLAVAIGFTFFAPQDVSERAMRAAKKRGRGQETTPQPTTPRPRIETELQAPQP